MFHRKSDLRRETPQMSLTPLLASIVARKVHYTAQTKSNTIPPTNSRTICYFTCGHTHHATSFGSHPTKHSTTIKLNHLIPEYELLCPLGTIDMLVSWFNILIRLIHLFNHTCNWPQMKLVIVHSTFPIAIVLLRVTDGLVKMQPPKLNCLSVPIGIRCQMKNYRHSRILYHPVTPMAPCRSRHVEWNIASKRKQNQTKEKKSHKSSVRGGVEAMFPQQQPTQQYPHPEDDVQNKAFSRY